MVVPWTDDSPKKKVFTSYTGNCRTPSRRETRQDKLAHATGGPSGISSDPKTYAPITRTNDDDLLLLDTINTIDAGHGVLLHR
jgi:hypothetical protein